MDILHLYYDESNFLLKGYYLFWVKKVRSIQKLVHLL
jgi:hypothetical protein